VTDSLGLPSAPDTVVITVIAPPQAGVLFAPDHTVQAQPGEVLTFTHTLTNTGEVTDTFDLTLTGDWTTLLTATPLTLTVGATATVQVEITVPLDATGSYATTITATSRLDSAVFAIVRNVVTIRDESPRSYIFLPLILRNY
ncbi:MAG: hypothetical protein ACP5J4_16915, partial [Anaerolineae bacterium]